MLLLCYGQFWFKSNKEAFPCPAYLVPAVLWLLDYNVKVVLSIEKQQCIPYSVWISDDSTIIVGGEVAGELYKACASQ